TLASMLFKNLGIEGATRKEQLAGFKEKGLFLTDTIKCIFYKNRRPSIPTSLIQHSARNILEREIALIDPEYICGMGNTALSALRCMDRFRPILKSIGRITEIPMGDRGSESGDPHLILIPFPNQRNQGRPAARERMDAGFRRLREIIHGECPDAGEDP
ncbi:MAG TPA: uracil-DNA glycosylase family protein, partial [Methanomicrobiales archaeon]|nr:uracil-DNA glycosylase family protein [Methanomicrobiales archaeon]